MADFPENYVHGFLRRNHIISYDPYSSFGNSILCGRQTGASAVWQAANTAVYMPFSITVPSTIYQLWHYNGTVVSGNVCIGVYTRGGTQLVTTGSVAQAGVSQIQVHNTTDLPLQPGDYYLAMAVDNITATVWRLAPSTATAGICGVRIQASAFPLPATATFALPGTANFPIMGGAWRSNTI